MKRNIRLFHVSDIHFGVEDHDAHRWFCDAVHRERPDAVICTGDITQRARKSQFAAAARWFASLNVPVAVEPGNHDMPYYNLLERFTAPFARFEAMAAQCACDPHLPGIALVSFRTTVPAQWRFPWSDGVIADRALGATLARLQDLQTDPRLKIVLCHHPLVGRHLDGPNPTIGGREAFEALAGSGADIVLSGHVHNAFDITHDTGAGKLRMIGAGTLSTRLRGSPPSYNVLEISPAGDVSAQRRELKAQPA